MMHDLDEVSALLLLWGLSWPCNRGASKKVGVEDLLEANVRVHNQQSAEHRVGDGVQRASGERSDGQGNETSRDNPISILALLLSIQIDARIPQGPRFYHSKNRP
jgi:hypothetical protein